MPTPLLLDKPRTLVLSLTTLRELETAMGGIPVGEIVNQLARAGVNAVVMSLWAGLKHEDPELTPDRVTAILDRYLVDGRSLLPVATALNAAFEEARFFEGFSGSLEPTPAVRRRRTKKPS